MLLLPGRGGWRGGKLEVREVCPQEEKVKEKRGKRLKVKRKRDATQLRQVAAKSNPIADFAVIRCASSGHNVTPLVIILCNDLAGLFEAHRITYPA